MSDNVFEDLGFSPSEARRLSEKSKKFMVLQEALKKKLNRRDEFRSRGVTAEEMLDVLAGQLSKFSPERVDELLEIVAPRVIPFD